MTKLYVDGKIVYVTINKRQAYISCAINDAIRVLSRVDNSYRLDESVGVSDSIDKVMNHLIEKDIISEFDPELKDINDKE